MRTAQRPAERRLQLEALFWLCADSVTVACSNGMTPADAASRRAAILAQGKESGLLDTATLVKARFLNASGRMICPLCLEELSGRGFFNRMAQAEGREVTDLTVTQLNLFHIAELRFGVLNHRLYNVGWGHHHCNVVVKDSGIPETLERMRQVLHRNRQAGLHHARNLGNAREKKSSLARSLRPWVKLLTHVAQALAGDVRVNIRGADAGVAEEFLNHAQVRAVLQQVRGEAVPHPTCQDGSVRDY